MPSNQNHARPIVLRELSLLRALGASLRTPNRPGKLRRPPVPRAVPAPPDSFAVLPARKSAVRHPDKRP
jgi:hypothetical protein